MNKSVIKSLKTPFIALAALGLSVSAFAHGNPNAHPAKPAQPMVQTNATKTPDVQFKLDQQKQQHAKKRHQNGKHEHSKHEHGKHEHGNKQGFHHQNHPNKAKPAPHQHLQGRQHPHQAPQQ